MQSVGYARLCMLNNQLSSFLAMCRTISRGLWLSMMSQMTSRLLRGSFLTMFFAALRMPRRIRGCAPLAGAPGLHATGSDCARAGQMELARPLGLTEPSKPIESSSTQGESA